MKNNSNALFVCIFLAILYSKFNSIHGDESEDQPVDNENVPKNSEEFKNMYIKMLLNKRKTQHEAIKRMHNLNDNKKEKEMLVLVLNKLFDTLKISLDKLAKEQSKENGKGLKVDKSTIAEVSSIIENTAFAADLALNFPKNFHKAYDKNKNWQFILEAAIGVTLQTGLIDPETSKAINLMSQELNIIEKEQDYTNPYSKTKPVEEAHPVPEVKKKKEKKKRGPGLSGGKADL